MPLPAAAAAALGVGAMQAGTGLAGIASTWIQNRKSRKWSEKMYGRQYDDNVRFWEMQNRYNAPGAQMQRLKEAGLNPNLVYGQGARGASGTADKITSPDVKRPQFDPGDFAPLALAGTNALSTLYTIKNNEAQLDLVAQQKKNVMADTLVKVANADSTSFDTAFKELTKDLNIDLLQESVREKQVGSDVKLNRDQREEALNATSIKEASVRVLQMKENMSRSQAERARIREAIKNIRADTALKNLDRQLWNQGITRNDPLWLRMVVMMIEKNIKMKSLFDKLKF